MPSRKKSCCLKGHLLLKVCLQVFDLYALLLHAVAVTDRDCAVRFGVKVIGDAPGRSDLILSSLALADVAAVIKLAVILL